MNSPGCKLWLDEQHDSTDWRNGLTNATLSATFPLRDDSFRCATVKKVRRETYSFSGQRFDLI